MNPYVAMALFGAMLSAFWWAGRWWGAREGRRLGFVEGRAVGLDDALTLLRREMAEPCRVYDFKRQRIEYPSDPSEAFLAPKAES